MANLFSRKIEIMFVWRKKSNVNFVKDRSLRNGCQILVRKMSPKLNICKTNVRKTKLSETKKATLTVGLLFFGENCLKEILNSEP